MSSWAWKHLLGMAAKHFIISSGEAKTHLRCHPGSPVALPASSARPGTAGSILATLMYPGQIPPVLEPARAVSMQHIKKQGPAPSVVQDNTEKEISRGKRDAVVSILQRGCGLRPALCIPHPSWSCQEAGVAQRVLSGAGGDARHQLCNGHWQAQGRAGCMGYSGEDSPELGALLANTTFALPTLQTRRNASFGSTSEPLPLLHSHGVSQKPLDR